MITGFTVTGLRFRQIFKRPKEVTADLSRNIRQWSFVFATIGIGISAVYAIYGQYFGLVTVGGVGLLVCGGIFLPEAFFIPRVLAACMTVVVILGAVFIGYDRATAVFASRFATEILTLSDGKVRARLIRAGERGVLFYDPLLNRVRFVMWNDVKSVETIRNERLFQVN
jgi:hypothetical protein